MLQYLYTLPVLFMTILCMVFLTVTNEHILSAHKKAFLVVFSGSFFVIICEVLSIFLNDSAPAYRPLHFLVNYFGFLSSPILIAFFAASIPKFQSLKYTIIGISVYFLIYNILVITKQLFFIDKENHYHRGNLFFLYLIFYILAVLYLLYETLRYSYNGFLHHKIFACLLSCCFLLSCSIQVFIPEVYVTRITVVFSLCIYYAYNVELTNLFDKLTGILNQGTYLRKIKEIKPQQIVIIIDVDDFKNINEKYGHRSGDECLKIMAQTMKSIFGNHGQCYRIGGDEFAVITKKSVNIKLLIAQFEKALSDKSESMLCRLSASVGYSKYRRNDTIEQVIQRADFNMYTIKSRKKINENSF